MTGLKRSGMARAVLVALVGMAGLAPSGMAVAASMGLPRSTEMPVSSGLPAVEPASTDFERTYLVELMGGAAGEMTAAQKTLGDRIVTASDANFVIKRGKIEVKVGISGTFEESLDHRPLRMSSTQSLGAMPIQTETTFGDSEMTIVTTQGGQKSERKVPLTDRDWLTPAQASRQLAEAIAALDKQPPGTEAPPIVTKTMDPSNGPGIITLTRTGLKRGVLELGGKKIDAYHSVTTNSVVPGMQAEEWIDARGIPILTNSNLGSIPVRMVLKDAEPAKTGGAAEMMVSTFVKPDRPIANARGTTRSTLLLSASSGDLPDLPSVGSQRFERLDTRSGRLTISVAEPQAATDAEAADPSFLAASAMVDAKDPKLVELTQKALQGVPDEPRAKAEALRRFVHDYINAKSLGVGFASASEVIRSKEGDCTEHGVLLAAMFRAAGIPSRVVSGMVYADRFAGEQDIFGYHMWTQALLKDDKGVSRWVDFDATLNAGRPSDATHIAMGVSSLKDGEVAMGMASVAGFMGRIQVKVESVE